MARNILIRLGIWTLGSISFGVFLGSLLRTFARRTYNEE